MPERPISDRRTSKEEGVSASGGDGDVQLFGAELDDSRELLLDLLDQVLGLLQAVAPAGTDELDGVDPFPHEDEDEDLPFQRRHAAVLDEGILFLTDELLLDGRKRQVGELGVVEVEGLTVDVQSEG